LRMRVSSRFAAVMSAAARLQRPRSAAVPGVAHAEEVI